VQHFASGKADFDTCTASAAALEGPRNQTPGLFGQVQISGQVIMADNNNTIAGWVLAAGIVALGSSIVMGKVFHSEKPEKPGFVIQGVEEEGGSAGPVVPLATLLAGADAAKGEALFAKCKTCHTIDAGGAAGVGPNIHGVLGKGVAGGSFAYSDALKAVGGKWDFETMNAWLTSPKKFANGNKMSFPGLSNAEERAALLLYLNAQGSNLPLPPPPAEGAAPAEGEAKAGEAAPAAKDAAAPADKGTTK
jgi:cytochrome c